MRSYFTLGLISLVGAAAVFACGDDDSDGGTAGTGGTAGAGGGAGTGGGAGSAGTGGGAGTAGTAGTGGTAGSGSTVDVGCTGCVGLTVPFAAASTSALYQIAYAAPGLDFSNATITWQVKLVEGANANLFVHPQIQNGAGLAYAGYYAAPSVALTVANFAPGTFVPVTLNVSDIPGLVGGDAGTDGGSDASVGDAGDAGAAPAGGFDKSKIEAIQLQVGSTAAFSGTQSVTVAVDSVTITGVTGTTGATFTNGVEGLTLNNYPGSPTPVGTPAPAAH